MATRTLSVQNARRPMYSAAACAPALPAQRRVVRRPAGIQRLFGGSGLPGGGDYLPRQSFTYSGPYRYGPDPEQAYAGDPASSSGGWYCFEGPIIEAANAWLRDQGSELRAESETGADLDRLEQLLRQGTPVAVWFTQDYEQPRFNTSFTWTLPDGSTYTPYGNLHCVVLTGMAETQCYLADPMQGDSVIERDRFERIYTAMGSRAVVLR